MNRVAVVGFGSTQFTRSDAPRIDYLLLDAATDLCNNMPSLSRSEIEAVLVSTNDDSKYLASILSELAGISPRVSQSIESMCGSGTSAIVTGVSYIAAGLADTVLVAGADSVDGPGRILDWDVSRGQFAHPVFWASLFTKSYKHKFNIADEELAAVPAKNHRNAAKNPRACSTVKPAIRDVLESRVITGDLRLFDCSRPCTGSSALILASEQMARELTDRPVWITGVGQKTTSAGFTKNRDLTKIDSTIQAGREAFAMASRSPEEVDVVELHDAFSVFEPLALEGLGLAPAGGGARMSASLYENEDNSVNPRGGLIGAGHPLGTTGVAQAGEIFLQIRGNAGKRQVKDASVGIVHNVSAAATSSTVLVMES